MVRISSEVFFHCRGDYVMFPFLVIMPIKGMARYLKGLIFASMLVPLAMLPDLSIIVVSLTFLFSVF